MPKKIGAFFFVLFTSLELLKCWKKEQCSKASFIFRGQQNEILCSFVAFCKMSQFTNKKCSATAQNKGGVQPMRAIPVLRPLKNKLSLRLGVQNK